MNWFFGLGFGDQDQTFFPVPACVIVVLVVAVVLSVDRCHSKSFAAVDHIFRAGGQGVIE